MSVLLVSAKDKGNTYDVLKYIENNSDAELLILGQDKNYDLKEHNKIIICSGVYGGNLHRNLQKWLKQIDKTSVNKSTKFYSFFTWIGRGQSDKTTLKKVKNTLEKSDISLEEEYMTCFGEMANIRHNHPNEDDYKNVLNWVEGLQ